MNEDMETLRAFRAATSVPSETRLNVGRERVVARVREDDVAGRRGAARSFALAGTVVAVTAVLFGAAFLLAPSQVARFLPFGALPDPNDTRSAPDRPSTREHRAAVELLERFAAGAAGEPLRIPAGQLLYVRESNLADGEPAGKESDYIHEMWMDPEGFIPLMIRRTDGASSFTVPDPSSPREGPAAELEQAHSQLAADGPSLTWPTPAYLAGLPTDPSAMLAVLTEQGERSRGDWSNEHGTFDEVRGLMHRAEPLLPPAVRAALYRALTGLDSIASTGEVLTVAGRQVYGIDQLERGERQRILLDAQTGRVVGYSSVTTGGEVGWTAVWRHAVTPASGVVPDGF